VLVAHAGAAAQRRIPPGARLWLAGEPADHFALIAMRALGASPGDRRRRRCAPS